MVQRCIRECDRCGAEVPWPALAIAVGQQGDPATGRLEDREEYVDLCGPCLRWAMQNFLKAFDHAQGTVWVQQVRQPLKRA